MPDGTGVFAVTVPAFAPGPVLARPAQPQDFIYVMLRGTVGVHTLPRRLILCVPLLGGTDYTVGYARLKGLEVINLASGHKT